MADAAVGRDKGAEQRLVSLPLSRIRVIMKSSPEVSSINQEALVLTAKATVRRAARAAVGSGWGRPEPSRPAPTPPSGSAALRDLPRGPRAVGSPSRARACAHPAAGRLPSLPRRARAPVPAIPPSLGSAHDSRPASRAAPALPRAGVPGPARGRAWPLFPPHVAGLTARSLRFPRFRPVSWLGGPTCSNGPLRGPGRRPRGPAGFREEGPALPPTHPLPASPRRAVPGPERKQFHEP